MARIRIIDEWLRSPVGPPVRTRAIFVVASSWAEQRVLMRAYAGCADQTRPTIVLHGAELVIAPAGTDPHGSWGIQVDSPVDGRAQELRGQLELASRRLAGSKGNPPRLMDEAPPFEDKITNNWGPGAPRDVPQVVTSAPPPSAWAPPALNAPPAASAPMRASRDPRRTPRVVGAQRPPDEHARSRRHTPIPPHWVTNPPSAGWPPAAMASSSPPPGDGAARRPPSLGATTALGVPLMPHVPVAAPGAARDHLSRIVGHTMPLGFALSDGERAVLNSLGEGRVLSARQVATLVGVADGVAWMDALMSKLAEHGIDLVAPGDDVDGEPTYVLRR